MQTLWSRIVQTRGTCGCPQCLRSVQGVSQRATASAARRARFSTSSTLWFSGIFAAATTLDAGVKMQRREQWDQAIAEVKQELGHPANRAGLGAEKKQADVRDVEEKRGMDLDALVEEPTDIFFQVEPERRPMWPTNTGPALVVKHLPPDSPYASEEAKDQARLRRWTPKKLEKVMLSMDILQFRIFSALRAAHQDPEWKAQVSAAVPVEYRDRIFLSQFEYNAVIDGKRSDLIRLRSMDPTLTEWTRSETDVAYCSYHLDDEGSFHVTARELNRSLQALFKQHTNGGISTPALLAKVAYNISLSSAPPNVHTYNTLLLGLGRAKQSTLVYNVIRSLRETNVRPNEITNSTILNHYTNMDDAKSFVHWIELMRGKHGGLALARPGITITAAGAPRLIRWAPREGAPEKVIQLPYPTPNVFGAVIKGVLKFSGFDTALSICEGMGHEGWGICMSGLAPLLLDCANRGDWTSGLAVWRQIQALKTRSASRRGRAVTAVENIPVPAYAAMLRLCLACDRKESFQDVWRQTVRTHRHLATSELTREIEVQKARASDLFGSQVEESELDYPPDHFDMPFEESDSGHSSLDKEVVADAADMLPSYDDGLSTLPGDWPNPPAPSTDNRGSIPPSDQALCGVRELREHEQQSQEATLPEGVRVDNAKLPTSRAGNLHPTAGPRRNQSGQREHAPSMLLREQLDGSLPPSHELAEYEVRERPMTMHH